MPTPPPSPGPSRTPSTGSRADAPPPSRASSTVPSRTRTDETTGSPTKTRTGKTSSSRASSNTPQPQDKPPRRLRADAQRNRDALLVSARAAFLAGETEIRVEEIARRAGVAVGTLYRHFDTREAVIEAVFRQEVEQLCASGTALLEDFPPPEALRRFLLMLVDHAAVSKGMAVTLEAITATSSPVFDEGRTRMETTLSTLLAAGVDDGSLREDISGRTVLRALSSICGPKADPEWYEDGRQIAGVVADGLLDRGTGSRPADGQSVRPGAM